jgi:cell shape-determining protein MreD
VGDVPVNWLHSILILATAFVAVFFEAWFDGFRNVFGTQIDFLPALMVYAGLSNGFYTITLTAVCGGLWFDSLSTNPLGVSILPLLAIGLLVYRGRELLARDHAGALFCLGAAASALQPLAVLFILLNIGAVPLVGWKSLWQWLVMIVGGGLFTPVCFALFSRFHRAFDYQPASQTSFRPDREIKRGRG